MYKTIAFISDIHLDEKFPAENGVDARKNWEKILSDIYLRHIDKIIFGGDIGSPAAHEYFFYSLKQYSGRLNVILGNHDKYREVKKIFSPELAESEAELFYSFEDNLYKYFYLDSSADKVSPVQLNWLEKELFISDKRPVIFIHHPVLQVNTPVDLEFPLINREEIKNILFEYGNEIFLFCGHYHMDDETVVENIKQFITPAASYQAIKEADKIEINVNEFGYRIINFIDDEIKSGVVLFKQ